MTCREKLKMEYPESVSDLLWGGCMGCPSSYDYLDDPEICSKDPYMKNKDHICRKCWDREIPNEFDKYDEKDLRQYKIDCGFGIAYLTTPYDPTERFPILANTCFGLRKSWMCCDILSVEIVDEDDYEHLWWNGDEYVWRKDGARKMISPFPDEEWQTDYCEKCRKE